MLDVDKDDQARICCGHVGGKVAVGSVRISSATNISERERD